MDNNLIIILLGYFTMIMLDIILISNARRLLLDFLIGQKNRKNAKKIHTEQSLKDKISMGYIYPMLKKYQRTFKNYRKLYIVILFSLIPQYAAVILIHMVAPGILWYVMGTLLTIRFLLACLYRLELGSLGVSVYAQKKK